MRLRDLQTLDLRNIPFGEADLADFNFTKSNLSGALLNGADLSDARLVEANLVGALLKGANLSGADLYKANLREAVLYKANLSGADLYQADLSGADLYQANLSRANLKEVKGLTQAQLDQAYFEKSKPPVGLPDGLQLAELSHEPA